MSWMDYEPVAYDGFGAPIYQADEPSLCDREIPAEGSE